MFSNHKKTSILSAIYTLSVVLLAVSLAVIFLEGNVIHAFRDFNVQEPGTSLAEWRWISLDPANLDTAPTTAIITAAVFGLMNAVLAFGWVTMLWFGVLQNRVRDCSKPGLCRMLNVLNVL
jgi:hypothetical protein